jgi:hypothetical protein
MWERAQLATKKRSPHLEVRASILPRGLRATGQLTISRSAPNARRSATLVADG